MSDSSSNEESSRGKCKRRALHPWEVKKRIKDSKMKESKLWLIFDHCWQRERGQATHASSAGLRPFADPAAKSHQIASRSRQAHSRPLGGSPKECILPLLWSYPSLRTHLVLFRPRLSLQRRPNAQIIIHK